MGRERKEREGQDKSDIYEQMEKSHHFVYYDMHMGQTKLSIIVIVIFSVC